SALLSSQAMAIFHFTSSIRIAIPTTKKNSGTQSVKSTNYYVNLVAWTLKPPRNPVRIPAIVKTA
ncbi:hypothetical protein N9Z98_00270, partial [Akkermansiaceae bacterium]|nr:hypothetical protein [Akkermansiaceae bacterium]